MLAWVSAEGQCFSALAKSLHLPLLTSRVKSQTLAKVRFCQATKLSQVATRGVDVRPGAYLVAGRESKAVAVGLEHEPIKEACRVKP
jgi:hypothetical protein